MTNWDAATLASLWCPKCQASNRPGATIIEVDKLAAVCHVCAHVGPLETFIPKPPA